MKKSLIVGSAMLAFTATAFAADLPVRGPALAPAPIFVTHSWTGFYVGLNAGYYWSDNGVSTRGVGTDLNGLGNGGVYAAAAGALATFNTKANSEGFLGGAQIGYNWQLSSAIVGGLEADIQGTSGGNGRTTLLTAAATIGGESLNQAAVVSRSLNYLGTVRARFGVLVTPNALVYATGGLAYGEASASTRLTHNIAGAPFVTGVFTGVALSSDVRLGWAAGAGIEWKVSPSWSVKGEYLYYDLGSARYSSAVVIANDLGDPFVGTAFTSRTSFRGHVARVGINYHFVSAAPGAVVAKY